MLIGVRSFESYHTETKTEASNKRASIMGDHGLQIRKPHQQRTHDTGYRALTFDMKTLCCTQPITFITWSTDERHRGQTLFRQKVDTMINVPVSSAATLRMLWKWAHAWQHLFVPSKLMFQQIGTPHGNHLVNISTCPVLDPKSQICPRYSVCRR